MAVIQVSAVSKRYEVRRESPTLAGSLLARLRGSPSPVPAIWALREVSLQVAAGETLGIIGANGAGKSTLLKVLSGVTAPTTGSIRIQGRLAALLEAGAGLHPDLTGGENIFLAGALLGLTRREVQERLEAIVRFADLGEALEMPLRSYSSGMFVRLGFAVAAHAEPAVLLLDEVLAVGDTAFQRKSLDRILRFKRDGTALVLVSHQLDQVLQLADRVMWLDQGTIREIGPPGAVIREYLRGLARAEVPAAAEVLPARDMLPDGPAAITEVRLFGSGGEARGAFQVGEPLCVRIRFVVRERVEAPVFGIAIYRSDGLYISGTNTSLCRVLLPALEGAGEMRLLVEALPLSPGTYLLSAGMTSVGGIRLALRQFACEFTVLPTEAADSRGIVHLPCRWELTGAEGGSRAAVLGEAER